MPSSTWQNKQHTASLGPILYTLRFHRLVTALLGANTTAFLEQHRLSPRHFFFHCSQHAASFPWTKRLQVEHSVYRYMFIHNELDVGRQEPYSCACKHDEFSMSAYRGTLNQVQTDAQLAMRLVRQVCYMTWHYLIALPRWLQHHTSNAAVCNFARVLRRVCGDVKVSWISTSPL